MKKIKRLIKKQGFTLVELIIVIAIIAVLAVAAFMMLTKWLGKSRDSRRLGDLGTIARGLSVGYSDTDDGVNMYPTVKDQNGSIALLSGVDTVVGYQGVVDDEVVVGASMQKAPVDPSDGSYYTYLVSQNGQKFQLLTFLEDGTEVSMLNDAYALEYANMTPTTKGFELGVLLRQSDNMPINLIGEGLTGVDLSTVGETEYKAIISDSKTEIGTGVINIPIVKEDVIVVSGGGEDDTVTCDEGYILDENGNCVQEYLYSFASHTFTNCGKTGYTGPTLSQCTSSYDTVWDEDTSYYNMTTQGIQEWTVPQDGTYRITAYGASGGSTGGKGTSMRGDFVLTEGEKLKILVGQMGSSAASLYAGGGGTFVAMADNTPLVVAGGGGGASSNSTTGNANVNTNGKTVYASGGTEGNGTNNGAGYYGNSEGFAGTAFINGGLGKYRSTLSSTGVTYWYSTQGGFGGGGEGFRYKFNDVRRAGNGGGGGYSGGSTSFQTSVSSTSASGGGAGSYNSGTNQSNLAGANSGHGKVIIEYIGN